MIQWLLRKNPALLGDVLEERASGRSRVWLWRQVAAAIARETFDDARLHPVLTLRAVATALATYFAAFAVVLFAYGFLFGYSFAAQLSSLWLNIPLEFIPALLAGWIVARTHRACVLPAVGIIILLYVLVCPACRADRQVDLRGQRARFPGGSDWGDCKI